MISWTNRKVTAICGQPGQLSIIGGTVVSVGGWALAGVSLLGVVSFLPHVGWREVAYLVVLCSAPPGAIWAGQLVRRSRRIRATITPPMLQRRLHGNIDAIMDGRARPLRPIGSSAGEVATRTGDLLAALTIIPSVRIFHGVCAQGFRRQLIAHALTAGRTLILVESVAWPSGHYRTDASGRISCDGRYIGQSIQPLMEAVAHWRSLLPRHRVSALVVVHSDGSCVLPANRRGDLAWVGVDDVLSEIGQRLCRQRHVSTPALAALLAATATE